MASTSAASLFVVPSRSQTPHLETFSSESEAEEVVEKKPRGQNYAYEFVRSFEKKGDFDAWWSVEKSQWTYEGTKWTKADSVETWYCKFAGKYSGRAGVNCKACLRIFFPQTSDAAIVKRRMVEHDHSAPEKAPKLPSELKARIRLLSEQGWMPKRIHVQLTTENVDPLPDLKTIQWFVNRKRVSSSAPFTDHSLRSYCENHSAVPDNTDEPYVLAFEVNSTESFYVIWTTGKLLQRQLDSDQLQADATSSTNWHNYPFLVVGHSNVNHNFVATLAAVGKSEDKYVYGAIFRALAQRNYRPTDVLADGTPAVTSAAKTYFPNAIRVMCFAHVIRRFDAVHKPKLPKHLQDTMRNEICLLQYARGDVEFIRMAEKLLELWRDEGEDSVDAFCETFGSTYIEGDLRLWHEGATEHCVNNNGRMLAFATFLEKVEQLVRYWSIHAKPVVQIPAIPLKVQKAAYQLQKECEDKENGQPKRLYARIKDSSKYVFASASAGITTLDGLFEAYNRSHVIGPETWEDFSECRCEVYLVQPAPRFGFQFYECTCRNGSKKEVCKHVAMVMCGLEAVVPYAAEVTAKEMQHNRKEKRKAQAGRTPLAKRQNRFAAAP